MSHRSTHPLSFDSLSDLSCAPVAKLWEGAVAWVESLEDEFVLHRTNGHVATDGITVIPPLAGNPAAGYPTAAWFRKQLQSQRWRNQYTWYLDPRRPTDEGDGATQATALRTVAELMRRLGENLLLNPGGMDITVLSDVTEAVTIRGLFTPSGSQLVYIHAPLPAAMYSGVVGSYVDYNDATAQDGILTDSGVPTSWTEAGLVGHLARVTSGAREGTEFFVLKDLGSKQARVTPPIAAPFNSTFVALQAGDAYSVYGNLIKFGANALPLTMSVQGGAGAQWALQWMELGIPGVHQVEAKGVDGGFVDGCVVHGLDCSTPAGLQLYNCSVRAGCRADPGSLLLVGGSHDGAVVRSRGLLTAYRAVAQDGGWTVEPNATLTAVDWLAAFDAPVGLSVQPGGVADLRSARLWGKTIATIGVDVQSAGTVVYNSGLPLGNLGAPSTQCRVGGVSVAYAALPNVNATNAAKVVEAA